MNSWGPVRGLEAETCDISESMSNAPFLVHHAEVTLEIVSVQSMCDVTLAQGPASH